MHIRNVNLLALALAVATVAFAQQDSGFQERYAANLNHGESYIEIINTGANGAPALGPGMISGLNSASGNLCINVYAIDPNEELMSCCSCLVTPDQNVSLSVLADLASTSETGVTPTSATVALVATLAGTGGTGTSCTDSAALVTSVANGMAAWGTTLHATPVAGTYATTSTPFTNVTAAAHGVTATNLASLTGRCASIIGNGSNHGICTSCAVGALGCSAGLGLTGTYTPGGDATVNGDGSFTLTATNSTYSLVAFVPNQTFTFAQLTSLFADFQSNSGGSAVGTPRFVVGVNVGGTETFLTILLGNSPAFDDSDAALNLYSGVNLIGNNDIGRYDTSQFAGGSPFTTYSGNSASALPLVGPYVVEEIDYITDTFTPYPNRNETLFSIGGTYSNCSTGTPGTI